MTEQDKIKKSAMNEKVINESVNNSNEKRPKKKELIISEKPLKPGQQIFND